MCSAFRNLALFSTTQSLCTVSWYNSSPKYGFSPGTKSGFSWSFEINPITGLVYINLADFGTKSVMDSLWKITMKNHHCWFKSPLKTIEINTKIHEKSSLTRFNQHWTAKSQLDSGIFGVRHQEGWLLKRSKTLHVWRRRWASLWDETKTGWFLPINSRDRYGWYPLVNQRLAIENGPVEIVDLPIDSMLIFHSYVNVYQRVYGEWCEMLNHVDMKWLEMIGVLKKPSFAEHSEIFLLFLPKMGGWTSRGIMVDFCLAAPSCAGLPLAHTPQPCAQRGCYSRLKRRCTTRPAAG